MKLIQELGSICSGDGGHTPLFEIRGTQPSIILRAHPVARESKEAQVDNTSGIHSKELDGVSFSTDSKTLTITLSSAEDETVADPVLRITLSDGSEDTFSLKRPPQEFMDIVVRYIDKSQIDELEQLYSPEEIIGYCIGACEFMVKDWYDAFSLLKELAIGFSSKEHPAVYAPIVADSCLKEKAREWLYAKPRHRRGSVVFVLGKLSDEQFLPVLEEAFEHWKDRDPFMMEGLIFELGWLGDERVLDKVEYLATHQDFVFRLTVIEGVQDGVREGDEDDIKLFEKLKKDPHPAVVAATKEDPYYFHLHAAECRHEVYGDNSDEELTLEDFRKWIEG